MFTFIYLIVISLSGYYLLTPFFRRELPLPVGFSSDGTQTLIHEKQLLLTELQEIEFDYNMGKLSDTDYAALTKEYKLRTAAVLKQLESRAQPSKKARKKGTRSEEHTSELQSHSFNSYAVFCLKNKHTPEI